ncbi:MAG: hypothetical protein PHH54_07455 [Candidatus Nanoarchaeia archaeon]|nr:hypothetical protein [Candidatus Nanoarchaeia archaeon]MDD5741792.1 hypothetical protein [Candidatus Nanoarchaeia archaeon]
MVNKLFLTIIVSVILTAIIISLVNVGTALFLPAPEWNDYCGRIIEPKLSPNQEITQEICESNNGTWTAQEIKCITTPCPQGYCDFYTNCQKEYEAAMKPYNQIRYYIFAGIGFILLLIGLFALESMIQLTGLATGGILVVQGIVMNFQNKTIVFISLIAILIIFGVIAWRIIRKKS